MTIEELNKRINYLKKERDLLEKRYNYYANLGGDKKNIKCHVYCISKMLDLYPYKRYYDKELDKLRYFEFTKEYISYVLDLINSIENKDIPENLRENEKYDLYNISNSDMHQYFNNNGSGVVIKIICKKKDMERIKEAYFEKLYLSPLLNEEYIKEVILIFSNIDYLLFNISKDNNRDEYFKSDSFINKYPYVYEFLDKLIKWRFENNSINVDRNYMENLKNEIIGNNIGINNTLSKVKKL